MNEELADNTSEVETVENQGLSVDDAATKIRGMLGVSNDSQVEHSEDNDGELTPEANADEADATENNTDDDPEYEIEIGGEKLPVRLSELRKGYLRQSDYTRKAQEVSELRKHYSENQRDVNQLRDESLSYLQAFKQQMDIAFAMQPQIDWDDLLENNPGEYQRQRVMQERRDAIGRELHETQMAMVQQREAQEAQLHQERLAESKTKFFETFPELRDSARAKEAQIGMTQLLIDEKFDERDMDNISDYRIVSILYRLWKAENTAKIVPQVVKNFEQKPTISAKETSRKNFDHREKEWSKFKQSGKLDDAAALIRSRL
ncbi:hypothetical protein [Sinorhizobium fredii]|uniref:hypothetical protein n=1 Tax=Rhizobium fredii TaxID=380 RepID=UPI0004B57BF3|nr:hypothetical protein [Sinorhizobium fredii]AWI60352.1 hypothetical protein AB395_00005175 [Sinorhizobium fredii CCBAU 45436]